ncbi:MAG: hypothetical protein LBG70_04140 [Bifidobacteriaceae bacterium]|nr:hypothetical protein [Bifidobacteriaceae bacterium]
MHFHALSKFKRKARAVAALAVAAALTLTVSGWSNRPKSVNIDSIKATTSAFQAAILADGVVTNAEYESAVMANWQCVKDAGFEPDEPQWNGNNFEFGITVISQNEEAAEVNSTKQLAVWERCNTEYTNDVGDVWASQAVLSDSERDKMRPDVVACLRNHGLELPEDSDYAEIGAALATLDQSGQTAAMECMQQYEEFFRTLPEGWEKTD